MKVRYAALGLALALAGCAAPYQSPAPGSKDVARVRVAQARQGKLLLAMELPGARLPNLKWGTGYRRIAALDGKGMHIGPTTRTVLGMPDARQQEGTSRSSLSLRSVPSTWEPLSRSRREA
ncbi:MAG: hypothetical protein EPO12_01750 [Aquabacterium sp.]|nr:MAG: hypothetical protein EPO12_01750 [Aquabacterium sp.]